MVACKKFPITEIIVKIDGTTIEQVANMIYIVHRRACEVLSSRDVSIGIRRRILEIRV